MKITTVSLWVVLLAASQVASALPGPEHPLRSAPRLVSVSPEELLKPTLLGSPEVRTLLGYTRRVLHLPDGHTLAVFSYGGSSSANWLFLIDGRDLSVRRYSIPNNDIGSHGAALGSDGNIYLMPYNTGRAYRFDVEKETFEQLETGLVEGDYSWDAFGASNGCIYFGTYPNAYLGEYNIATGKFEFWKQVVHGKKYVVSFSETPEGLIRFVGWGPGSTNATFDPQSREIRIEENPDEDPETEAPAPAEEKEESPTIPAGDDRISRQIVSGTRTFGMGFPTSRFLELRGGTDWRVVADPEAPAEMWLLETIPGAVIGISHFGIAFRFDLETGDFKRIQIDNLAPGGNAIMFIESVQPNTVIGANYSQQNLWKIDAQTGDVTSSEGMVARVTGEPMCGIGFGGLAYIGIYGSSLISLYDPNQSFEFGTNPRELIELGKPYKQTRPRDTATDGKHVFMSSDSEYGYLGGALAAIDPETERIDVYHHLIKDQNLPTLAYDPKTRLLWGGTDRWGQMRSHPPTQESSLIYAFDPEKREVVTELILWPGADETAVLGILPGGVFVASASGEIALIDTETRELLFQGGAPFGKPSKIKIGADGAAYCIVGEKLCRWDSEENTVTPVAAAPGCKFFTEPSPGLWVLADNTSVYRFKVEP